MSRYNELVLATGLALQTAAGQAPAGGARPGPGQGASGQMKTAVPVPEARAKALNELSGVVANVRGIYKDLASDKGVLNTFRVIEFTDPNEIQQGPRAGVCSAMDSVVGMLDKVSEIKTRLDHGDKVAPDDIGGTLKTFSITISRLSDQMAIAQVHLKNNPNVTEMQKADADQMETIRADLLGQGADLARVRDVLSSGNPLPLPLPPDGPQPNVCQPVKRLPQGKDIRF